MNYSNQELAQSDGGDLFLGSKLQPYFNKEEQTEKEWTNLAKVVYKRCVTIETPVLCADLIWRQAGELKENDEIIAFEEGSLVRSDKSGRPRRLQKSIITHNSIEAAECVEIVLEDGTSLFCTADHSWLVKTGYGLEWKEAKELIRSNGKSYELPKIMPVWEQDSSYEAGYLAAAFDGEGSLDKRRTLSFVQTDNEMFSTVKNYLDKLGYKYTISEKKSNKIGTKKCYQLAIYGRYQVWKFLGSIRPKRLLKKFVDDAGTMALRTKNTDGAYLKVTEVKSAGKRLIAVLSTSSKTHITAGFPSHNTYARKVRQSDTENWRETVLRVIEGNVGKYRGTDLLESNEEERLFYYIFNRKAMSAGRGLWFSGSEAHNRIGGAGLVNPLHESTKLLTQEYGWVEIGDVEGQEVTVLSNEKLYARDNGEGTASNPIWVKAQISSYDYQNCYLIKYKDSENNEYEVIASENHRWYRRANTKAQWERVDSTELKVGDLFPRVKPTKNFDLSIFGAQHGFFFGDGNRNDGRLPQFEPNSIDVLYKLFKDVNNSEDRQWVSGCPTAWGYLPEGNYTSDKKYLYGFLAGYFAADGSVHKGDGGCTIASARLKELEKVKNIFQYLGIATGTIRLDSESSNLSENRELYVLPINKRDLSEKFFLKDSHLELWKKAIAKTPRRDYLRVTEVTNLNTEHRVLCATVPHYEQFVIEGFCLTSNCWGATADKIENFVMAQDLLMLGGGVGMSVEHKYVSKLPKVKQSGVSVSRFSINDKNYAARYGKAGIQIEHQLTNDADFIVPDSREGWCELTRRVLRSYFETGKSFTYSTICVRGKGEPIHGFGGTASGAMALIEFIEKLCLLLDSRSGKSIRPIDAADIICLIGEMVVAGNVRRSAILILGDCWDKQYLQAKRWDLGSIPTQRAMANFSVVCDDIADVHPMFWESYKNGEPFGIVNRTNIQTYGRMGEEKSDTAVVVNPCAEIGLENGEPCNLTECFLPNLSSVEEFKEAARLMFRWSKRITCEDFHNKVNDEVVKRNRRIGVGITGCLEAPEFFNPEVLDEVYQVIQKENRDYSEALGVPESIRTTTVKPSGSISLVGDVTAGIHPAYSSHYIRRVRFSSSDNLIALLKDAGHKIEPVVRLDGSFDHGTSVVEFPIKSGENTPTADGDIDTWKQLEILKMVQKHWADNSVSVTVYYKKENLDEIKTWLKENLKEIKTISFLCYSGHGFTQAPYEPISEEEYNRMAKRIKPIAIDMAGFGADVDIEDCSSGSCPLK